MGTHYFKTHIKSSTQLKQFEDGNIILYSLNNSFSRDVLWQICVRKILGQNDVQGKIEKLKIGEIEHDVLESEWDDAKNAVRGAFTKIDGDVNRYEGEDAPQILVNLSNEAKQNIAFTLGGNEVERNRNKHDLLQEGDLSGEIFTWEVRLKEDNKKYVHGLVELAVGRFPILVKCARVLGEKIGKDQVTWLQYCTNAAVWKQTNQLHANAVVANENLS